jgi:hypothetical protein
MIRVIRNRAGHYLKADGEWSEKFDEAECFDNATAVINARMRFRLTKVEMLLVVGARPSKLDVVVPMSDVPFAR